MSTIGLNQPDGSHCTTFTNYTWVLPCLIIWHGWGKRVILTIVMWTGSFPGHEYLNFLILTPVIINVFPEPLTFKDRRCLRGQLHLHWLEVWPGAGNPRPLLHPRGGPPHPPRPGPGLHAQLSRVGLPQVQPVEGALWRGHTQSNRGGPDQLLEAGSSSQIISYYQWLPKSLSYKLFFFCSTIVGLPISWTTTRESPTHCMFYNWHLYKGQPVRAYGFLALLGPKT